MTNACDDRHDAAVHDWFELSYAHYLVLPRSLMQAMPKEWQYRMVTCLEEMREACKPLGEINDHYIVTLRDSRGRFVKDPYSEYRHPVVQALLLKEAE